MVMNCGGAVMRPRSLRRNAHAKCWQLATPARCSVQRAFRRRWRGALFEGHIESKAERVDRARRAVVAVLTLVEHLQIRALGQDQVRPGAEAVAIPLLVLELIEHFVTGEEIGNPAESLRGPAVLETYTRAVGIARGVERAIEPQPQTQAVASESPR